MLVAYVIPVAAVGGAVVAAYLLGSTIKYTPNLFFCAVVLSSWLGGVGAGIFSILLSVFALDYYFIPPIYALGLSPEETPDMILFVAAGFFVNWVNQGGNHAKGSTTERPDERNPVFRNKNRELGKSGDLLRVDHFSGDSADKKLDPEASAAMAIREFSGVSNLLANKVRADDELRREHCTQEPGPDKTQVASLNGSREPLRTSLIPRSGRDSVFCKHGDYWTIEYEGQRAWLKATRGLECLACLLGNPGREFHVIELIGPAAPDIDLDQLLLREDGNQMRTVRLPDGDPILDGHAKAEYKSRLTELRAELEDAQSFNDLERAEKIREESNAITEQLARAVGLGGRNRRAASQAERARSAITKRIRNSIQKIAKAAPTLGSHLSGSIKTGYFCSYNPDPNSSVSWKL